MYDGTVWHDVQHLKMKVPSIGTAAATQGLAGVQHEHKKVLRLTSPSMADCINEMAARQALGCIYSASMHPFFLQVKVQKFTCIEECN